jgi:hypothetical protein
MALDLQAMIADRSVSRDPSPLRPGTRHAHAQRRCRQCFRRDRIDTKRTITTTAKFRDATKQTGADRRLLIFFASRNTLVEGFS